MSNKTSLPPLRLNSTTSNRSNNQEGSNVQLSARERRRQKILQDRENESPRESPLNTPVEKETPRRSRRGRSVPLKKNSNTNQGYESDEKPKENEEEEVIKTRPPHAKKTGNRKKSRTNNFKVQALSNNYMLKGLEEDIIEMDENESLKKKTENTESEILGSMASFKDPQNDMLLKSIPTNKFYLELEKKFAIQDKELYEKKEQERLRQQFEWQLKQKQKEELKYQIKTPKTALNTHKFLRRFFLFFQGLNVGFQFWQLIIVFFAQYSRFELIKVKGVNIVSSFDISLIMLFFENLTMPFHSLTYFFLTICLIDTIDRVDLTKMNLKYFVKCISFQNQFWSIILYSSALIISLTMIFIDQPVYLLHQLRDVVNLTDARAKKFQSTINDNIETWKYLSLAKTLLCILAWLLFSVFISKDETYNSLEKRDFSLIDEMINEEQKSEQSRKPSIQLSSHPSNLNANA